MNPDNIIKPVIMAMLIMLIASCGNETSKNDLIAQKKAQLDSLKKVEESVTAQIRGLEKELSELDSSMANPVKEKLVGITAVASKPFAHYIELQGKVDAVNIAYVTPRGQGGQVKAVYVKQGDRVRKGQLLLKLDDVVANQQLQQAKVQLSLAEDLYNRRKNLWEKQIGTEVELLQAKTNVENLRKSVELATEQVSMSNVYAEISGVADMVNIKVGELFLAATASQIGIRIVNTNNLKIIAQVPENYLHKVKVGSVVSISLPDVNKTIVSKVSVKGSTIDPASRSFYIEAKIPAAADFRPNQLALVRIQDYAVDNAVTIPLNTLQNDEKGKYVMVASKENGKLVARKRVVEVGELYGNNLEVKSGLQPEDALITEGFQGLYDGQPITTGDNS